MATRILDDGEVIGKLVYEAFSPQKPAKIIAEVSRRAVLKIGSPERHVQVKFLDGKVKEVPLSFLNDFEALISDHRKKLETHTSKLELLKSL